MLAEALRLLRCPACGQGLAEAGGALRCPARHSYDIARQGYVALALGAHAGDGAEMVAARGRVLSSGLFDPLAEALAEEGAAAGEGAVIELGAGTGWYLARVLERLPDRVGVALDVSKPALRRAARAHPRAVAVGADVWGALPVQDGVAGLILSVFAPRNADETARVLAAGRDARGRHAGARPPRRAGRGPGPAGHRGAKAASASPRRTRSGSSSRPSAS